MPKSMRIPVLVFENKEEVEIMLSSIHTYQETQKKYDKVKVAELLKGYKYLKDIKPGLIFLTESGMKGVYLESTPTSAKVIITSCKRINEDDRAYYLGKQNISSKTEVKICG
jgi:ribosomal protein S8